jgi:HlyD family secretion protein
MLADSAATQKQMDDINSQIDILDRQIDATRKGLTTSNTGILAEIKPLQVRLKQIEDQLEKSKIKSPINGTVLNKYAEEGEFTVMGKPLFKIAGLDSLILKAYISETQLSEIKIGQNVKILIDSKNKQTKSFSGRIISIANQAEFTPKIVQTKEERVNLVYAIKIKVPNDGSIKIGMPGEVYFSK